jgi:hypothetical protein
MKSSQELWDTIERLHLLPSGETSRIKARWFRPDRQGADDVHQFARWLVTNDFLTKYAIEQIGQGRADQLRLGQYQLLEPCKAGPHAGSFLASDTLGRKVLLDLVDDRLAAEPELVRAFEAAAERAMGVQHVNVNRVLDFGQAQGRLYLVREDDEGVTLAEVLARRNRLEPDHAARLFAQAFAGLQALHEKQVQGGELTPESLLLATTGKKGRIVKILRPGVPGGLFRPGTTVQEVVPQLRPLARAEDDLFRLGQAFYQALTGQPSAATLAGGTARPVRELAPAVPDLLADTVEQLLSPDLAARPRAASRVAKTLRVYLASAEETREARAEEEIASPNEPAAAPAPAAIVEEEDEPAEAKFGKATAQGRLAELWAEFAPSQREWFFLAGGAAGIILLVLLAHLITGIHFINVVCLLTGAAVSFLAERMWIRRQAEAE